ncbi:MAG: anaerobic glycerol-3-phosphate dehydrogenase subunit A [Solirubrobacterales bacterium]|nr:anaerobic glycerol-3-phosphate dehydrogenase subunit A [Solirubrobacterales bacterium]
MEKLSTDVLVIGGGATGAGVAWDAALRGLDVVLVERGDLGTGTSGRFHGLLHSGGRYAVKDPSAADECARENLIVRHIAPDAIEDTGGFFVTTPFDDPAYADRFALGCRNTGVPCEEIEPAQALREEPRLNPRVSRAFRVPDASIDVWRLVWALARGAQERGARVLPYHEAVAVHRDGDEIKGARVRNSRTGDELDVEARITVSASGAWAGKIAGLAGIEGVQVRPGRGIMIAMNHRLVNTVVNRCQMPTDGDIIVPIRTVCVVGTTDVDTEDPDDHSVIQDEVDAMLAYGERLVPGFKDARALRVWTGVRPLFEDTKGNGDGGSSRDVTRAHALLDHMDRDGVSGFFTITGGKLTTYRLMAQDTVDAVCRQLGDPRPCTTATERLPGSHDGEYIRVEDRLGRRERHLRDDQLICECELIPRRRIEDTIRQRGTTDLDDVRRLLRLGMGPCQGGFCIYRAAGILHGHDGIDTSQANRALVDYVLERWKGVWPILYGDQLRQARLDDWIFQGVLDIEHLP